MPEVKLSLWSICGPFNEPRRNYFVNNYSILPPFPRRRKIIIRKIAAFVRKTKTPPPPPLPLPPSLPHSLELSQVLVPLSLDQIKESREPGRGVISPSNYQAPSHFNYPP